MKSDFRLVCTQHDATRRDFAGIDSLQLFVILCVLGYILILNMHIRFQKDNLDICQRSQN